jgi:hypothetical protein
LIIGINLFGGDIENGRYRYLRPIAFEDQAASLFAGLGGAPRVRPPPSIFETAFHARGAHPWRMKITAVREDHVGPGFSPDRRPRRSELTS